MSTISRLFLLDTNEINWGAKGDVQLAEFLIKLSFARVLKEITVMSLCLSWIIWSSKKILNVFLGPFCL